MNKIILKGVIRKIEYSHTINSVDYNKADLVVNNREHEPDVVNLRFKSSNSCFDEDDEIEIVGNLRSYSKQLENGKNKVQIYVFTYMDLPEQEDLNQNYDNKCFIDGRICKLDSVRYNKSNVPSIHFILANNIFSYNNSQKLNNYIPCVAWGNTALKLQNVKVGDKINVVGKLHSRTYKKVVDGETIINVAHELVITDVDDFE